MAADGMGGTDEMSNGQLLESGIGRPTGLLRFVKREVGNHALGRTTLRILQQQWCYGWSGELVWRDVPLELEG